MISENDFNTYRNTPLSMPAPAVMGLVDSADSNISEESLQPPAMLETQEHWPTATLTWKPNTRTLEASFNKRKAIATGKDLVPESFHKKLFVQKKAVIASVMVKATGNKYVIAGIGLPGQPP